MFNLNISIQNPWTYKPWQVIWQHIWPVTKHRTLEICIDRYANDIIALKFNTTWRGHDHAGPYCEIRVLGLGFTISLPDNRHWDYNDNYWENY